MQAFPLGSLRTLTRALLCLALPLAAAAQSPTPFNLLLEGNLPGATQLQVSNVGVKGVDQLTLTLAAGKLDKGITIALGKPRVLNLLALDAEGRELYRGEAWVDASDGYIPQVGLEFKSAVDGAAAEITLASHRIGLEFAALERDGRPFTRLTGQVFDANGARIEVNDEDLRWGFDDPTFNDHFIPCPIISGKPPLCVEFEPLKPDLLLNFDICFRKGICKLDLVPPKPPVWRQVSVGFDGHACALKFDGSAYCWGNGHHGQLGYPAPQHCSENISGIVKPWGCNEIPAEVQCANGNCGYTQISAGVRHTCALDANQDAWCWGGNSFGERGNGSIDPTVFGSPVPHRVGGGLKFTEIRAAWHATCGLTTTHEVFCWGDNVGGFVPHSAARVEALPVKVSVPGAVEKLDFTWANVCAQVTGGDLFCWGTKAWGQLGNASFTSATHCTSCPANPVRVQDSVAGLLGQRVSLIASGSYGACAHLANNQTACWGLQPVNTLVPTAVEKLTYGFRHFCGKVPNRQARCSGAGAMGDGQNDSSNGYGPVKPVAPRYVRDIDAGGFNTCAVGEDERVLCWGHNRYGSLGNGTIGTPSNLPVEVFFPATLQFPIKEFKKP
jgi:hypothetical protein